MKILHVTDVYGDGAGGSGLTVASLCGLLETKGHQNSILYGMSVGVIIDETRPFLFIKDITDLHFKNDPVQLAQLDAFLQEQQPDVVQFYQILNSPLIGYVITKYPSVVYVYNHTLTCPSGTRYYANSTEICSISVSLPCIANHYIKRCGSRKPNNVIKGFLRTYLTNKAARNITQMVAISNYMKQTLINAGYNQAKIRVIPSLSPAILAVDEAVYDYPSESNILLFVGRITELKGLEFLVRCLPLLKQAWKLVVVGDGYRLPQTKQLVQNLGLQAQVEFNQWVPNVQMVEFYRQAAIVVVPSLYPDPFVLIGLEAMKYSRPVVAFNVGGIPDWLQDGYNGFLCRYPDIVDMAAKIDILLADKVLAAQFGSNGKRKLQAEFDPGDITNAFLKLYQEAIDEFQLGRNKST